MQFLLLIHLRSLLSLSLCPCGSLAQNEEKWKRLAVMGIKSASNMHAMAAKTDANAKIALINSDRIGELDCK